MTVYWCAWNWHCLCSCVLPWQTCQSHHYHKHLSSCLPSWPIRQSSINRWSSLLPASARPMCSPGGLAQMQPPLQPHSLQQALQQQQQQPSIHLRHPQPQQFQNINLQQQQHPTGKVHIPAHPHLTHPQLQMHLQLQQQQQQVQQHPPPPAHHHHPQQLLSPGNPQLQQQQLPSQQQMHVPPPPTTPTQNIAASVNQLHLSQHHHQVNLATQVQAHNSNSSNGEGSNSNGGSGNNLSLPSNNNSIVTSTVTTTKRWRELYVLPDCVQHGVRSKSSRAVHQCRQQHRSVSYLLSASDSFLVLFVGVVLNLFSTQIFSQVQNVSYSECSCNCVATLHVTTVFFGFCT